MRSFKVAQVWGIPIKIHISLLVVLPLFAWLLGSGQQIELYAGLIEGLTGAPLDTDALTVDGAIPWIIGSAAAVGLFASVALHELGHAWAALRYDLEVESITLWILGGLASLSAIPREWNKEFWIAVAGPATSVVTGLACYGALFVIPASQPVVVFVVGWLAVTNVVLAVFNMVPAFPMDGGRVLRALLARNRSYAGATRTAATVGKLFAILFGAAGLLGGFNPMLVLLALFIYGAASSESRTVALGDLLEGLTVTDMAAAPDATIEADATVSELVTRMFADRRTEFAVVEDGDVVGVISGNDFRAVAPEERETTTVADLMATDLPTFDGSMSAFDALVALDQARASEAFVTTPEGTRVVSRTDFASAMEMRKVLGRGEPL
ncbi:MULTISPECIES: site-2 protease family protein [Halomicrobium]|uniref:Zinc metalloprotease n=2 Tax=Halomicrobium mukohataei TaxID=57705 RepID=C7NXV2_HALMD|nr:MULTISPECIES: site-2 protease family protein [Halomicrobium]ACV46540.1 peptidase M50 [Halomicrobium mukohataei DSM 12286]QCD65083.1 CBS domain-containing protein [Halomicrobium mukohataei]QFR19889.1 CBS domain-containing protein [Halomicrobium sp. ZPS1]